MNETARNRKYLLQCEEDLERAQESEDSEKLSLALANYAYALSLNNRWEEGIEYFDKAEAVAGKEGLDIKVLAHGLGLRSLVYQEVNRLPDAFRTTKKMLNIAQEEENPYVECDAVATQGQILMDSGKHEEAFQRFQQAEKLAQKIEDKHRLMRVKGALADLSISVSSLGEAERNYRQAISLAGQLGEQEAEMGFTGNLGSVLEWQGEYQEALNLFQEIYPYYEEQDDQEKIIGVLDKMVRCYDRLERNQEVFKFAAVALELLDKQENKKVFDFLKAIINAYYREGKIEEAREMISEAISKAQFMEDREHEVEFLMNLGNSFLASGASDRALEIYQDALKEARDLEKLDYEAYLEGRLGYVQAEQGNLNRAVDHHSKAIALAESNNLSEVEGEQRSMLAFAYQELGKNKKAREQARKAVRIYEIGKPGRKR
ncbi:MAG: tetratricopeptide repeat protein [Anaerolineales bacterium]|nr:tetratricopeptide repeat protein [Anaerolineales bacterium]